MRKIFLYGPPASGKTTLGKALAEALGWRFADTDEMVVMATGSNISNIFANQGEAYFRERESEALVKACDLEGNWVVALGGGTLLKEENRALAEKSGEIICLEAPSAKELAERIAAGGSSRPLGDKAKERAAHYASFKVRLARYFLLDGSTVIVGNGLACAIVQDEHIVADENVDRLYPDFVKEAVFVMPSGEEFKTPQMIMEMWSAFAQAGIGRKDRVVAVGGGVTGDMTGFAAATWMRGIGWINVPTTLLSMVDASTGGKTGCDLPEGKNLAGAFHSPRLVIVDTEFLKTLPPEVLRCGLAEMIKHAAIGGKATWGTPPTAAEIAENLAVKVGIVREDPFETKGRRILLNCGHTIGHAVEKASNYQLSHGEAVAIGCVEEAKLAVRLRLADDKWVDEFAAAFKAADLPTELPAGMTLEGLVEIMRQDKKRAGTAVTFTLPCGWGDVRPVKLDLAQALP